MAKPSEHAKWPADRKMTAQEATQEIQRNNGSKKFDWLHGRTLVIDLGPDRVDYSQYEHYNGANTFNKVVSQARAAQRAAEQAAAQGAEVNGNGKRPSAQLRRPGSTSPQAKAVGARTLARR